MQRRAQVLGDEPVRTQSYAGGPTTVGQAVDHAISRSTCGGADGTPTQVGGSGNVVGEKEEARVANPQPGIYVQRVINFASTALCAPRRRSSSTAAGR